ncbi:MAG TPA: winged helix-turn-helix transcriptional regulator [Terriglobales bacterium]|nr:winged helix-turn-helix transcriptional regulator [Terriglobales bacterium]
MVQIVSKLLWRISHRRDGKILACLREYGTMSEVDLQRRTAITVNKLRRRLEFLAQHELVRKQVNPSLEPVWKIHHPRVMHISVEHPDTMRWQRSA